MKLLREILNWSEVWAILIPLAFMLIYKNKISYLKPVRVFVWVALLLNTFIDVISNLKIKLGIEENDFLWNNNFLYNVQSVVRFALFAWFFILLKQRFMHRVKLIIPVLFIVFLVVNFAFFEKFIPQGNYETFSSRLLTTESALLLFYCLQYFIFIIIDERTSSLSKKPGFWVVVGLTVYVSVNFFIYLFYTYLLKFTWDFAIGIWDVHNIVFIVFCLFLAKQFQQESKNTTITKTK